MEQLLKIKLVQMELFGLGKMGTSQIGLLTKIARADMKLQRCVKNEFDMLADTIERLVK